MYPLPTAIHGRAACPQAAAEKWDILRILRKKGIYRPRRYHHSFTKTVQCVDRKLLIVYNKTVIKLLLLGKGKETEEGTMENRKRMVWIPVLLVLLLCIMPAVQASAEPAEGVWLRASVTDEGVVASICVNTTVSDGMIELQYDSAVLSFDTVQADSQYVAARAVNDSQDGLVKIAWVAPGDYGKDGSTHVLLQIHFRGASADSLHMTGTLHTPYATVLPVITMDFTELDAAITKALAFSAEDYTADSFAVLEAALAKAQAAREDVLTGPAELMTALEALNLAADGLVEEVVEPTQPTQPSEPTQPAPTQPAEPTTPTAPTQPVDPEPDDQHGSGLWIGIVAALAVAAVAAAVVLKKKKEVRK